MQVLPLCAPVLDGFVQLMGCFFSSVWMHGYCMRWICEYTLHHACIVCLLHVLYVYNYFTIGGLISNICIYIYICTLICIANTDVGVWNFMNRIPDQRRSTCTKVRWHRISPAWVPWNFETAWHFQDNHCLYSLQHSDVLRFFFLGRLRLVSPSQILLMLQNSMKMHGARRRPGPIMHPMHVIYYIWVVVSNMFYFYPYLGKIPILTNIFQMGWNHQLDIHSWLHQRNVENTQGRGALAPTSLQFWGLPEREKNP